MGDLMNTNRTLIIKRHEHSKTVAQANIQAKEIRIIELNEEIERCHTDMEAQKKVIEEAEKNIKQQYSELEKDKSQEVKPA